MNERDMSRYGFDSAYANQGLSLNQYVTRTFGWMFLGLTVTFALGALLAFTGAVYALFSIPYILMVLMVAELAVVFVMSFGILKRSVGVTRGLFFVYSALNGVVFSVYFAAFEMANMIAIFGLTALFFGAFALYGHFTRTDLSRLRPLLVGGLIFLILVGLLSMFLDLSGMERLVCMVGIAIFLVFTAYDTQKIQANYNYFYGDAAMLEKASVFSALQLYLDFINLFLYLFRFLGRNSGRGRNWGGG